MTTTRLVALRLFNVTLGRTRWGARLLRWILLELLVRRSAPQHRYTASSRFYDPREME
jgi:hypothetical protein